MLITISLLGLKPTSSPISFQYANTTECLIKWDRVFPLRTVVTRAGVGRQGGSRVPERSV